MRHIYYLRGLVPCFVVFVGINHFDASLLSISTFLMCYLWPYFLFTPGTKRKYSEPRYRRAFVGLLLRLDELLKNGLPGQGFRRDFAISVLTAPTLCLILFILTGAGELLFALSASALFCLVYAYLLHAMINADFVVSIENQKASVPEESSSEPSQPVQSHQKDTDSNS